MGVDKSVAKEIRTNEPVVLEIWLSQVSCADFVFICILTSFLKRAIISIGET